ncbi:flavodoxin [Labilibaculum euxinus]|uniref:Flavodoxin n=1 Tax=Labilibaculum euxinus TaxID=2686357 RepID=A0A7M4D7K9_9BACT|nr:flavodoxin [Labilibaculum euxinus]MUP38638.1 flavodoxin [Labilibaculum euxinus]MVB07843.1 flavodoxin [Labilibaculum euxinus]
MKKIGLFYSFNTNKTAKNAEKIKKAFGSSAEVESVNVEDVDEEMFLAYDNLILGVPTWFDGELPNYWDEFMPAIEDLKLKGKTVALFGLGDQVGYPENFVDAIGLLAIALEERGAKVIGLTSPEGYKFEKSVALRDGKFLGLALDIENQAGLSNERIEAWVEQLKKEFK